MSYSGYSQLFDFCLNGDDDMTNVDLFELPFGIFAFSYDEDDSFDEDFEDDDFDDEESFDGEDEDEGYDW